MTPQSKQELAAAYSAAAEHFDAPPLAFLRDCSERTVQHAALSPGAMVLDVCCGSGNSALPAARAIAPTGRVIGVDLAPPLLALARATESGGLSLEPGGNVEETLTRLTALPGIGEWTTQYVAMRALAWQDAFPHTDLGIAKVLGEKSPKRILEIAGRWRPWRAYAAMHLWKSLEDAPSE